MPHPFVINIGDPGMIRAYRMKGVVYVGRPSVWGNPYREGADGTRDMVIKKYREWINHPDQEVLRESIREFLKGKFLGCYCAPLSCHADVLAEIANSDPTG